MTGRVWRARACDDDLARAHSQRLDLPDALGRVLAARDIALEDGESFLSPRLKASLPDPATFIDMERAAELFADALETGRKLAVFADYDVDGATSAAQLIRYVRAGGAEMELYVPDRVAEGYGPSGQAFSALKNRGVEVVVTVDCGAMAHDALAAAASLDLEVIVLDHHQMTAPPPETAAAVVNPNRPDCPSGAGMLAAAGVTFHFLVALNRVRRARGHFAGGGEPDLMALLDLAALGTFCDVVPLVGVNRALAAQGLKVMSERSNPGIAALAEVAGSRGPADAYTAGFVLGPRINAGGRIGRADLGARLLSTDDRKEAGAIAAELDALNRRRRDVEQEVLDEATRQVEADPRAADASVITVAGAGWHPGVIGVVAGRLKEKLARPVVVIGLPAEGEEGEGKGSGRSVTGVDLGGAVAAAREAGLLIAGGGHAMAAGLTVAPDRVDEVAAFLSDHVATQGPIPPRALSLDGVLSVSGVNRRFADTLGRAGPFGPGNPEPVFAVSDVTVAKVRAIGDGRHLRVTFEDAAGDQLDAAVFRAAETGLEAGLREPGGRVHIAVKVRAGRKGYVDV
ncbi:MAG: single-stranded-DNA-specific exonuclease RecJ, partial [Caulobacterales bacterium]|nr:single-stranded-DNA-specific exonuclease RecJ [Caulobacterales bacterium]